MKSIFIKLLAIILLTTAGIAAYAQPSKSSSAKITGTLLDDKNKPMDFATVSLLKAADS